MNDITRRLLTDALRLPEADRAELAASLIDTLDEAEGTDVDLAWDAEIQHRLAEIHRGEVTLLSFDEARDRLFGKSDGQPSNLDFIPRRSPRPKPPANGTRDAAIQQATSSPSCCAAPSNACRRRPSVGRNTYAVSAAPLPVPYGLGDSA